MRLLGAGLLALLVFSCHGQGSAGTTPSPSPPPTAVQGSPTAVATAGPTPGNPNNIFGVVLRVKTPDEARALQDLGVAYYRPYNNLSLYGNFPSVLLTPSNDRCTECDLVGGGKLGLLITVRNSSWTSNSSVPTDIGAFKSAIARIVQKYRPRVLVVENEEDTGFFWNGTAQDYGVELAAACQAAHSNGVPCSNGGMESGSLRLLVWNSYLEQGNPKAACEFAKHTSGWQGWQQLCGIRSTGQLPSDLQSTLTKLKAYLAVYRSSGMDYMNFHWYMGTDPSTFDASVGFLNAQVGLPLINNEMGQRSDDPAGLQTLLSESLKWHLRYVAWFSADILGTRGLFNGDGTLRPQGEAFRSYLHSLPAGP